MTAKMTREQVCKQNSELQSHAGLLLKLPFNYLHMIGPPGKRQFIEVFISFRVIQTPRKHFLTKDVPKNPITDLYLT